jgi:hypothetical protein
MAPRLPRRGVPAAFRGIRLARRGTSPESLARRHPDAGQGTRIAVRLGIAQPTTSKVHTSGEVHPLPPRGGQGRGEGGQSEQRVADVPQRIAPRTGDQQPRRCRGESSQSRAGRLCARSDARLLRHVQVHLTPNDPRRQEFERIAQSVGIKDPDHPLLQQHVGEQDLGDKKKKVDEESGKVVSTVRGASSAALREQLQVRSFRNMLVATIIAMTVLAVSVAFIGFRSPTMIPLCFAPEEAGRAVIVCPTAHSASLAAGPQSGPAIDNAIKNTAKRGDLFLVEFVGLTAAAMAAAAAVRGIRGSSEPYGLPLALAVLKLPTGAITALLGLLLMRGQFVPGLSALDTSAQILAWALVFGYAQQLFTRLIDQQAHNVLNSVRGADKPGEPRAATP